MIVNVDQQGVLSTDLYVKPTDTHQFLLSSSCHPRHVMNSIVYSQALRIKRICSDPANIEQHCLRLEQFFVLRGYSRKRVRLSIRKALDSPSSIQRISRPRTGSQCTPLVVTYHPGLPNLNNILRELHPVLLASDSMRDILPEPPLLSFRRPRNLRNELVRAKLKDHGEIISNVSGPCNRPRCELCHIVPKCNFVTSKASGQKFGLQCGESNCASMNVVYVLWCTICGLQYVGQTNNLRLRLNNHKSCARNVGVVKDSVFRLYEHYRANPEHSFNCTVLQTIHSYDSTCLKRLESKWIHRLRTFYPLGLNMRNDL